MRLIKITYMLRNDKNKKCRFPGAEKGDFVKRFHPVFENVSIKFF